METFSHVRVVIGMILSLGLATLLRGAAKLIQHPGRQRAYWVHLLWGFYIFLTLIHFWWWEHRLMDVSRWTFLKYFFVICFVLTYFGLAALLFPDDIKDYNGFEDYFYSRKKWFFGGLALTFVLDIVDTLLKGSAHLQSLGPEYPIKSVVHVALCLVAMASSSKRFHGILVLLLILYQFSYIMRMFNVI
ncbi:hypothetical protein [Compostibacter hankyongensis]|uniref:Transmembrane protein n=1 Tax=Compostibacter hankyongensis TaxID=1007089 RepID=A0ABP8FD53_9BACT